MGICGLEHQRQSWLVPAQARDFDVDPRQRGVIKHGDFWFPANFINGEIPASNGTDDWRVVRANNLW